MGGGSGRESLVLDEDGLGRPDLRHEGGDVVIREPLWGAVRVGK